MPKDEEPDWKDGLYVGPEGKRPKGLKRFVWNGYPAKLGINARHLPANMLPEDQGSLILKRGDTADLTPKLQKLLRIYIRKGNLVEVEPEVEKVEPEELPEPERRSKPDKKPTATERQKDAAEAKAKPSKE